LERRTVNNKEYLVGYHTQEFRQQPVLDEPILCDLRNAWLGSGYYFWTDVEFAKYWGEDFKTRNTGYYDVYSAEIDIGKCLNTVFNEKHYFFFLRCIEKAINHFQQKEEKVTLKEVHEFLEYNFWKKLDVTGVLYDDLPSNPKNKPNRKYSVVEYEEYGKKFLYYKKRIQVVVFSLDEIHYSFSKEDLQKWLKFAREREEKQRIEQFTEGESLLIVGIEISQRTFVNNFSIKGLDDSPSADYAEAA